jgi:hypothetical protein
MGLEFGVSPMGLVFYRHESGHTMSWNPEHDANQAMMLLASPKLKGLDWRIEWDPRPEEYFVIIHRAGSTHDAWEAEDKSMCKAICLAFVRAFGLAFLRAKESE